MSIQVHKLILFSKEISEGIVRGSFWFISFSSITTHLVLIQVNKLTSLSRVHIVGGSLCAGGLRVIHFSAAAMCDELEVWSSLVVCESNIALMAGLNVQAQVLQA